MSSSHYHRIKRGGNQTAVVFIHGLAGHYRDTWRDFPNLIVQDSALNHCDIICWGYPTGLLPRFQLPYFGRRMPTLATVTEALASDLANPEIGGSYSELVLAGHSMGGLVIMQMIISALTKPVPNMPLLERICHILLYATPSDGVQLNSVLKIHRQARQIDCNGELVNKLRSDWINRVYTVRAEDPPQHGKIHIFVTAVVGTEDNAVSENSARAYYNQVTTVSGDHGTMCKPISFDHGSVQILKQVVRESTQQHLVQGAEALIRANLRIVQRARQVLYTIGSRSRDEKYLREIETKLGSMPSLVHYRILMGPPRRAVLKDHLQRLLELRSSTDRSQNKRTIYLGLFEDYARQAEIFLCGNEQMCLVVLPPMTGVGDYSTAMVFTDEKAVAAYRGLAHALWQVSTSLDNTAAVAALQVMDR